MPQKLLLALLVASRKLRHYFQGHPIKVVSAYPLERMLRSPNAARRVAEWNIELQAFQLEFSTTRIIKGAALADFVAEWTDVPTEKWVSNNITEYKGPITGLKATTALGVRRLTIRGDSQLLVNFSNKAYKPKDEHMEAYLEEVRKIEKRFLGLELQHVPRGTNKEAIDIAKRVSRHLPHEPGVFEERLFKPSAAPPAAGPTSPQEELPPVPLSGAPACSPTSGAYLLLALEP
ncbi:uncharacterized protein [Aegilops tauschii subsp. strangulata]|uniref:uncharacterized protein n=1 Tax=Aegilops tauschii subsp. strangulata TaxID=200361 RepID=UPI003CC86A59